MDDKEDGELSASGDNSFDLDYKPAVRPDASQYRPAPRHLPSSDEDCNSSDSDSDTPCFAKRKRPNNMKMDMSGSQIENGKMRGDRDAPLTEAMQTFVKPKKRNNIWASVMQEQVLNQEISGFGLKKRLDHGDRSVESYDYREALKMRGLMPREEGEDESDYEEDEEMRVKRTSRKRPVRDRLGARAPKPDIAPVELVTLELDESISDQEYGQAIANGLFEEKPEIIIRVVETMGRKFAMDLYNKTKTIEQSGGLLIMDCSRRRTSGGVYLQLLKSEDVSPEDMQKIFPPEESENWRKRKRAHRKRERHESKPQGEVLDDGTGGGVLSGLFSDEPIGAKCPGSTPVTTPQHSDNEDQTSVTSPINQLDDTDLIKVTSPPRSSHTSPVHPQPPVLDPRAMDPRAMDPRAMDPRAMDPRAVDPRAMQQTNYDNDFLDLNAADDMDMF